MIFKLTTINCQISQSSYRKINRYLKKINRYLPNIESDLVVFRILFRKNIDRYHPPKTHPHPQKDYTDIKPVIAYYEGSMTFRLGKKQLYVHFKGTTIDECIDTGFDLIFEELKRHKDLHFSSESDYPDKTSIRGGRSNE